MKKRQVQTLVLVISIAIACIGIFAKVMNSSLPSPIQALFFGISILGVAFILSWAAEAAQLDMSRGLAIALLALIAVLPEYAVDLYFAWTAAFDPSYTHFATANMTGANRLLVGLALPLIVILYWIKTKKNVFKVKPEHRVELSYLFIATLYSFVIVLKGSLSLIDTIVLFIIFALYMKRVSRTHQEKPYLVGPAELIGNFSKNKRRITLILLFLFSSGVILMVTEPFAEALIESGSHLGVDEFLLVQWLSPLASEAPEFIIAIIYVTRNLTRVGFETLMSSKINQWTLLVGSIPLVYSIALGGPSILVFDDRQIHEMLLTGAQSLLLIFVMINLRMSWKGAITLMTLFFAQFLIPDIRLEISIIYFILVGLLLIRHRNDVKPLLRGLYNS